MKIEITPQTKIVFRVIAIDTWGNYKQFTYETLAEARITADWCENNHFTDIKLQLIAES